MQVRLGGSRQLSASGHEQYRPGLSVRSPVDCLARQHKSGKPLVHTQVQEFILALYALLFMNNTHPVPAACTSNTLMFCCFSSSVPIPLLPFCPKESYQAQLPSHFLHTEAATYQHTCSWACLLHTAPTWELTIPTWVSALPYCLMSLNITLVMQISYYPKQSVSFSSSDHAYGPQYPP